MRFISVNLCTTDVSKAFSAIFFLGNSQRPILAIREKRDNSGAFPRDKMAENPVPGKPPTLKPSQIISNLAVKCRNAGGSQVIRMPLN